MELTDLERRLGLAGDEQRRKVSTVLDLLSANAPQDWRQLAAVLAVRERLQRDRSGFTGCRVLGISGGQGAGKSTLAALLVEAVGAAGGRAASCSLDDFYLTRTDRQGLARSVHPLLATRGVPGTHDVTLACAVIDSLVSGRGSEIPVFDKAADDRLAEGRRLALPLDVLIFEGWCVGAPAQPAAALHEPINSLEAQEDPAGDWRRYVNDQLRTVYPPLWQRLDSLLYLQVPSIEAVVRWRTQQEQNYPPGRRMPAAEIVRFVAHYERLTRWMGEILPGSAQLLGLLNENHGLEDLIVRNPRHIDP